MKSSAIPLLIAALLAPTLAAACEPTADQMKDYWSRYRESQEIYLANLARDSDRIFTGTVVEVTSLTEGPYAQIAHVNVDSTIKGSASGTATAKMWLRVNPERDGLSLERVPNCDETPDPAQNNPYVLETYRYLFYVKDGVLLRANGFPLGPAPLEPADEIELLKRAGY